MQLACGARQRRQTPRLSPTQPSLTASHTSRRTVSRPPSTSRVTVAFLAAASSSSFEAKVACGQPSSAASIWPVCSAERQAWEGGLQGGGSSSCKQHNTTQHNTRCAALTIQLQQHGSHLCCRAWSLPPGRQSWRAAKFAFPPGCCHRQSPACPAASAPAPLSAPPAHHGFGVAPTCANRYQRLQQADTHYSCCPRQQRRRRLSAAPRAPSAQAAVHAQLSPSPQQQHTHRSQQLGHRKRLW